MGIASVYQIDFILTMLILKGNKNGVPRKNVGCAEGRKYHADLRVLL
jgi:hypothetical protein